MYPARLLRAGAVAEERTEEQTVVLPVALPSSGPGLLHAALALASAGPSQRIYALHLKRTSEETLTHVDPDQLPEDDQALQPVLAAARARRVEVRALSFASRSVARDVLEVIAEKGADLVVMGWHKPVVGRSILSGTVSAVLRSARADVAVLVERAPPPWRRILVPYRNSAEDRGALEMARRIAAGGAAEVTILHVVAPERPIGEGTLTGQWSEERFPDGVRLKLVPSDEPLRAAVQEAMGDYDLIVVGVSPTWGTTPTPFGHRHEELARATSASLLVVRTAAVQKVVEAPGRVKPRALAEQSDLRSRAG
jgi:nucleotide-binding universal stress UspA family protein